MLEDFLEKEKIEQKAYESWWINSGDYNEKKLYEAAFINGYNTNNTAVITKAKDIIKTLLEFVPDWATECKAEALDFLAKN